MNEKKLIEKFKRDYYGIIAPISLDVESSIFWISYSTAKEIAEKNDILITDKIFFFNEWPTTYPIKVGIKDKEARVVKLKNIVEPIQGAESYKDYSIENKSIVFFNINSGRKKYKLT